MFFISGPNLIKEKITGLQAGSVLEFGQDRKRNKDKVTVEKLREYAKITNIRKDYILVDTGDASCVPVVKKAKADGPPPPTNAKATANRTRWAKGITNEQIMEEVEARGLITEKDELGIHVTDAKLLDYCLQRKVINPSALTLS